jgi:hypothetical protein
VYFSGHAGWVSGEFTLLAADAAPPGTRERRQQPFGLLLTTIADEIRVAGAQAQIFFIDACRGDPYVSSTLEIGPSSCGDLKEPLPEGSLALFSASAGGALEFPVEVHLVTPQAFEPPRIQCLAEGVLPHGGSARKLQTHVADQLELGLEKQPKGRCIGHETRVAFVSMHTKRLLPPVPGLAAEGR